MSDLAPEQLAGVSGGIRPNDGDGNGSSSATTSGPKLPDFHLENPATPPRKCAPSWRLIGGYNNVGVLNDGTTVPLVTLRCPGKLGVGVTGK